MSARPRVVFPANPKHTLTGQFFVVVPWLAVSVSERRVNVMMQNIDTRNQLGGKT